jgi:hypothetical protein
MLKRIWKSESVRFGLLKEFKLESDSDTFDDRPGRAAEAEDHASIQKLLPKGIKADHGGCPFQL